MPEANVANTVTILGKTSTVKAETHWKTIAINDPANRAVLKINSLFITNNSRNYYVDVDLRIGRLTPQIPGAMNRDSIYTSFINILTIPIGATVVAISRDNPIWLQPGDFLQIVASRNYSTNVVCSYEFISDQMTNAVQTLTPPNQVMHLNAAQTYGSQGAQLAWMPPFDDGGPAITNYVVQLRGLLLYNPVPLPLNGPPEIWTDWVSLHKPVTDVTSLKLPPTLLTAIENSNGTLTRLTLLPSSETEISGFKILGWQFRVAAINPVGVGEFSEPSALVRINAINAISLSAVAGLNRVMLSWSLPSIPETESTIYRIFAHNIRWSSDNGMTWQPSPSGQRLNNAVESGGNYSTTVTHLQNGVYYTFAIQPIAVQNEGTLLAQEVVGPWSPPTKNVMPPGEADEITLEATLQTLFVNWV